MWWSIYWSSMKINHYLFCFVFFLVLDFVASFLIDSPFPSSFAAKRFSIQINQKHWLIWKSRKSFPNIIKWLINVRFTNDVPVRRSSLNVKKKTEKKNQQFVRILSDFFFNVFDRTSSVEIAHLLSFRSCVMFVVVITNNEKSNKEMFFALSPNPNIVIENSIKKKQLWLNLSLFYYTRKHSFFGYHTVRMSWKSKISNSNWLLTMDFSNNDDEDEFDFVRFKIKVF